MLKSVKTCLSDRLKSIDSNLKITLKKLLKTLIKYLINSRKLNICSLIKLENIYVTQQLDQRTYSVDETATGTYEGEDIISLKNVLNQVHNMYKTEPNMFDTLTEHETVALSDFFDMVEEITGKTVVKLLRHPLLSSLHRQISHIVYVNNRIQRLDSKNFKKAKSFRY